MPDAILHRFERDGKRFAVDPESCFFFECDGILWDVLEYYPRLPVNRIYHLLSDRYNRKELIEVVGELEWLRASKSILTPPKREDLVKMFDVERGVKVLTVELSEDTATPETPIATAKRRWFNRGATSTNRTTLPLAELVRDAVALLLNRSGQQRDLQLNFVSRGWLVTTPESIAEACRSIRKSARLADKKLTITVEISDVTLAKAPKALEGHTLSIRMEFQPDFNGDWAVYLRSLAETPGQPLGRWAKLLQPEETHVYGRVIVQPNHADFGEVAQTLDEAGFSLIELDLDGAYVANPRLDPSSILESMGRNAEYYADRLLANHYFRLDPIAPLFWRIYGGVVTRRADPAGTNELAIAGDGSVYPSRGLLKTPGFRAGSVSDGILDESSLSRFEDVGALTTGACVQCWARNLCGGGKTSVHQALSGSFRQPRTDWCDTQREWVASSVSAFHKISSAGIHFERIYKILGKKEKPSLFTMARAALSFSIGVRPIQESDAAMLTHWENWNESAYFLFGERGIMLATQYDREMDSLHPRGMEHELMLISRKGDPLGLLKIRPDRTAGLVWAWVVLQDTRNYENDVIRKGFRAVLREAGSQDQMKRVVTPVSAAETGLQAFLESVGFTHTGVMREALYLHGEYQDVYLYAITADTLT